MKKAQARRRQRIPAFGEWNYGDHAGAGAGDWPVTQYFDSAIAMHMQAGLVMAAVPPSPKPANKVVKKWSESGTLEEDEKQHYMGQKLVAKQKQGKQSRVADAGFPVAVDQDLYHIPPDMLCHDPRKRLARRSLWMGCLGGLSSCIA